ncbi:putative transcriptional regulator YwtF [Streptomyces sp. YIM 130001]|uniref:LCP family protein n=1 Tax=Streptomyces sp. YIM 130001 TaxID=2259644 RepID=UPI000E654DAD|nr:LCP family protein [Streptomyces sp. YIM 130001]RII14833.1 putative transcriptional regulator YwtF [Streptomyces sp. YIM 130001]
MSHERDNEEPEPAAYGPPARGVGRGRGQRVRSHRRALKIGGWVTLGVVALGGAGLAALWSQLDGNIQGTDINTALGQDRPDKRDNGAMNILLLGSDSRAGTHGKYGSGVSGARSDTAMVLHIDKSHRKADVVSVPRDTLVNRPACPKPGGGSAPAAQKSMFNASYQAGGPACTVKTVEKMSGVRMDHYLEVDFKGFRTLIDELGGVDIQTERAIADKDSQLSLSAGHHTLRGEQALELVRTRHGVGDGSDLGRIQLQQSFIKALMHRVRSLGLTDNPAKLYDLADTATRSVSTDSELASARELLDLADELQGIKPGNMNMTTLPVTYDPQHKQRVIPLTKDAQQVWEALRQDRAIPKSATSKSAGDQSDSPVSSGA